jgi:hypothetical protein
MQGRVPSIAFNPQLWLFGGLAVAGACAGYWAYKRSRRDPAEKERRRRLTIDQEGRMAEALITDADETTLHYTYEIRGVTYTTSQDVTTLRDMLPKDPTVLIGHASLKYSPRNPANSILLCESWSGLRARQEDIKHQKEN